ncbi:MAG: OB-fold domain-containing protein [Chloroflexi bacterium]|nr:OB-fold domain-containing protein [Chloroflexota bacterium]MBU1660072.1 OB-fold domain-containing protein [Chloroflexota bacterium]
MSKLPSKRPETLGGYIVHNIPFPVETDPESLAWLKKMAPIQIEQPYQITYLHSYAQDSPWFAGLTNKRLLANRDTETGYTYPTPRGNDMYTGAETEWIDITDRKASIHAFTVCHFGSEEFLPETPYVLIQVEFEGANTLLLARLMGVDPMDATLDWIGMEIKPNFLRNSKLKPTDVYFVPA